MELLKFFIRNYHSRHCHALNKLSHIIGIPLVLFGIFQVCTTRWRVGLISFFLGYLLQWIGHAWFDKNEVGEWTLIKNIARRFRRG